MWSPGAPPRSSWPSTLPRAVWPVEGRLQIRAWQDKEGNNRRSAEVVADNVYFGDSRRDSDGSSGGNYANNSYGGNNGGYSAPAGGYAAPVGGSGFSEIDEEDGDLPF